MLHQTKLLKHIQQKHLLHNCVTFAFETFPNLRSFVKKKEKYNLIISSHKKYEIDITHERQLC